MPRSPAPPTAPPAAAALARRVRAAAGLGISATAECRRQAASLAAPAARDAPRPRAAAPPHFHDAPLVARTSAHAAPESHARRSGCTSQRPPRQLAHHPSMRRAAAAQRRTWACPAKRPTCQNAFIHRTSHPSEGARPYVPEHRQVCRAPGSLISIGVAPTRSERPPRARARACFRIKVLQAPSGAWRARNLLAPLRAPQRVGSQLSAPLGQARSPSRPPAPCAACAGTRAPRAPTLVHAPPSASAPRRAAARPWRLHPRPRRRCRRPLANNARLRGAVSGTYTRHTPTCGTPRKMRASGISSAPATHSARGAVAPRGCAAPALAVTTEQAEGPTGRRLASGGLPCPPRSAPSLVNERPPRALMWV